MTRPAGERHDHDPDSKPTPVAESDCLPHLLNLLAGSLEQIRAGKSHPQASEGVTWERWEDEGHVYVEARLSPTSCPEIDICIHDSKAYIRMER